MKALVERSVQGLSDNRLEPGPVGARAGAGVTVATAGARMYRRRHKPSRPGVGAGLAGSCQVWNGFRALVMNFDEWRY